MAHDAIPAVRSTDLMNRRWNRAFAIGVGLNVVFVVIEALFGLISGSLALLADAGHNLGDVLGLLLAWGAHRLAQRPATATRTYGWRRGTILASLASAILLLLALGAITTEAVGRLRSPAPIATTTVMWVAAVGMVLNALTAWLFAGGRHHDLNLRGAYLHMAADAAISAGVVAAAGIIALTGWLWVDPVLSLAIVAVIAWGTWGLLRESTGLAFDGVPAQIDAVAVRDFLLEQPGVREVHDLHIWAMSTTETALTTHLVMPAGRGGDQFLHSLAHELERRFGIDHCTVQVEHGGADVHCRTLHRCC